MPDRRRFSSRVSLLERVTSMRKQADESAPAPARNPPPEEEGDRVDRLEARIEHLEAALEGLQDAVHTASVRHDERITELQRRTDPAVIAQALSSNARERGL
jgi:hypothetical protein